jgi:hypothetical protein
VVEVAIECLQETVDFASPSALIAACHLVGADCKTNVAARPREKNSKFRGNRIQGTLARPREAKVGGGSFFAKSYSMVSWSCCIDVNSK